MVRALIASLNAKLVADWQKAYKWLSVQGAALGLVLIGSWEALPEKLKDALPTSVVAIVAVVVLVGIIAGRLVDQKPKA